MIAGQIRAAAPAAPDITPGLWEITVQTRSPIVAAPISHTVCIDKANTSKPQPPKSKAHDDCQVMSDSAAANETAYTVRCAKRKVTSASRFTYFGDHFNGTVTIQTASGEVQQVYTAVRLGDCDDLPDLNPAPPAK
jgi:hypothetical protein